jgi:hypothetical protein
MEYADIARSQALSDQQMLNDMATQKEVDKFKALMPLRVGLAEQKDNATHANKSQRAALMGNNATINNYPNQAPTSTVTTDVQQERMANAKNTMSLDYIENTLKPEDFTYKHKAEMWALAQREKLGAELPLEQQQELFRYTDGKQALDQFFLNYRKLMTGVAGGEKEMARIEQAFVNRNLSPTEFKGALKQLRELTTRVDQYDRVIQGQGFKVGTPEYSEAMKSLYEKGFINKPGEFEEQKGMNTETQTDDISLSIPVTVETPEDLANLPSGKRFITIDGRTGVKK